MTSTETPVPRRWFALFGCGAVVIGFLVVVVPIGMLPDTRKPRRGEVPTNVDAIKTPELAYHDAHGAYIAVPFAPRELEQLDKDPVAWSTSDPWTALGWRPDGAVRGAYRVVHTSTGFEVALRAAGRPTSAW